MKKNVFVNALKSFKWGFFAVSFIIITVLSIQSPVGITTFPLLVIFIVPVLFILWILKLEKIKNLHIRKYVIPLLFAILVSFFVSVQIIKWQSNLTEKEAVPVIDALNKFHTDYNKYPNMLVELKGSYINNIPMTKMGWLNEEYYYNTDSTANRFALGFKYIAMFSRVYDSEKREWDYE
jgi:hypothetical protein